MLHYHGNADFAAHLDLGKGAAEHLAEFACVRLRRDLFLFAGLALAPH
ncbi:hypothetical protein [Pseudomonas umsongensis]|nr:hypothetical protein [Pseudomonas umsongensis]MCK8682681.1 hypothetical protein [Pseudomonas umsongensis]